LIFTPVKGAEHSSAFSVFGSPKSKLVVLGSSSHFADLISGARSFSIEHVSPATLVQQEISHHATIAAFRKWFWSRKPDAGFLLEGFPATLLQAKVLDEWLEARGETLTAVIAAGSAFADIQTHYRTQGLLLEADCALAARPQDLSLSKPKDLSLSKPKDLSLSKV
jgi:adenylate kinase